jgi:hypothetical protein
MGVVAARMKNTAPNFVLHVPDVFDGIIEKIYEASVVPEQWPDVQMLSSAGPKRLALDREFTASCGNLPPFLGQSGV